MLFVRLCELDSKEGKFMPSVKKNIHPIETIWLQEKVLKLFFEH